ncbi:MAG: histidine phosphatase family protein [Clostridia bacterium]|nr:histidine phosphatase family protein [Clostridia bacterium]
MKITVIRHAETTYNAKGLFQGQIECELTEKGLKDTIEKAKDFPKDFDVCFCSPLTRTKRTAEILVPNLDIICDERIIETGLGDWEGTSNTEEKQALLRQKQIPPNGETFEEIDSRIIGFMQMLKSNYTGKNILVVTHAGVIYAMLRVLGLKAKKPENLEMMTIEI